MTAQDRNGAAYERVRARLIADLPTLAADEADAMLTTAGADKPRSLRQLDRYFDTNPDALFTGDAASPLVVIRLTLLLHKAGHAVVPPGCVRCGQMTLSRYRRPEGRICDRCARDDRRETCVGCGQVAGVAARRPDGGGLCAACGRKDPRTFRDCVACGRLRRPARRLPDGGALCQACAPRRLHTCAECGRQAAAQAITAAGPVCKQCYGRGHRPTRVCGSCGQLRPISKRATGSTPDLCADCLPTLDGTCVVCGRLRPGHLSRTGSFYCNSCRRRRDRPCAFCRQVRPVKANWPAGPACTTCYHRVREHPEPCAGCTKVRVLIGADPAGQPICGPCAGVDVDYLCSACGQAGRVYAAGRCFRCVVGDRLRDMLGSSTGEVPEQLEPLATALGSTDRPRSVLVWLGRSRAARLLTHLTATGEPISHELLDTLPADNDVHYVRHILVRTGVLPQR